MSHQIHFGILASMRLTAKEMTTPELVALYQAVNAGFDPKAVMGYEKARSLFTEADGTRMHASMLEAFDIVVRERLSAESV